MRYLVLAGLISLAACDQSPNSSQEIENVSQKGTSDVGPTGESCTWIEEVPRSRGRGHGAKFDTVTFSEPAYLRGDINSDGVVNRDDARLAVDRDWETVTVSNLAP